jgi:hypothetical protein
MGRCGGWLCRLFCLRQVSDQADQGGQPLAAFAGSQGQRPKRAYGRFLGQGAATPLGLVVKARTVLSKVQSVGLRMRRAAAVFTAC